MCSFVKTMEAVSYCCLLLCLLCSISPCQGLPALQQRSGELDVDAYIDAMLASLHQVVVDSSLDPMQLPDLQTDLSQTVAFGVTLHGLAKVPNIKLVNWKLLYNHFQLQNGKFTGVSKIKRTSNSSFTITDNVLEIKGRYLVPVYDAPIQLKAILTRCEAVHGAPWWPV